MPNWMALCATMIGEKHIAFVPRNYRPLSPRELGCRYGRFSCKSRVRRIYSRNESHKRLTEACAVRHTAGNNHICSSTSPGGVGADTKADRDGSHLGWKLPQPHRAEGRPGAF